MQFNLPDVQKEEANMKHDVNDDVISPSPPPLIIRDTHYHCVTV